MILRHAKFDMTLNDRHKMNGVGGGEVHGHHRRDGRRNGARMQIRFANRPAYHRHHEIKEKFNCLEIFSFLSFSFPSSFDENDRPFILSTAKVFHFYA